MCVQLPRGRCDTCLIVLLLKGTGLRQRTAALFQLGNDSFTLSLHDCDESARLYDPQPVLLKDYAVRLRIPGLVPQPF